MHASTSTARRLARSAAALGGAALAATYSSAFLAADSRQAPHEPKPASAAGTLRTPPAPPAAVTPPPTARAGGDASALHPNLVIVDSRAIRCLFTIIRDENTVHLDFSTAADRLMRILAEEGLAQLPSVHPVRVRTPCGFYDGLQSASASNVAAVSIVRAGDTLLEAVRRVNPGVAVGKILIQRDESDEEKRPKLFYVKVPADIADRQVMLVDPMLATGGSAVCAIEELLKRGVKPSNIVFLNVVSCPEGLARLAAAYPEVKIVTAAVDERLNEHKYIVPGLGDFGDRYLGTDVPAPAHASSGSGGRRSKPPPTHTA